jgi:hypothetical protein
MARSVKKTPKMVAMIVRLLVLVATTASSQTPREVAQ